MVINMGFGAQLEKVLKNKGISVSELSKMTGLPSTTLYSVINRDSNSVGIDKVKKIESALDIYPGGALYNLLYDIPKDEEILMLEKADYSLLPYSYQSSILNTIFGKLTNRGRTKILDYADDIAKIPSYLSEYSEDKS